MKRFSVTSEKVIKRCFTYYDNISTRRNLWWNNRTDLSHQRFWCSEAILSSKMQIKDVIHVKVKIFKVQLGFMNTHASGWSLWRLRPVKSILLETVWLNRLHIFSLLYSISFLYLWLISKFLKKANCLEKTFYTIKLHLRILEPI